MLTNLLQGGALTLKGQWWRRRTGAKKLVFEAEVRINATGRMTVAPEHAFGIFDSTVDDEGTRLEVEPGEPTHVFPWLPTEDTLDLEHALRRLRMIDIDAYIQLDDDGQYTARVMLPELVAHDGEGDEDQSVRFTEEWRGREVAVIDKFTIQRRLAPVDVRQLVAGRPVHVEPPLLTNSKHVPLDALVLDVPSREELAVFMDSLMERGVVWQEPE